MKSSTNDLLFELIDGRRNICFMWDWQNFFISILGTGVYTYFKRFTRCYPRWKLFSSLKNFRVFFCDDISPIPESRMANSSLSNTVKNTAISPNFLVWKFCGKAQFLQSFGRFARNYGETVPFHKILLSGKIIASFTQSFEALL